MPKVSVYNVDGSQVGEVELNDAVFGIEPNQHVLYDAVLMQRASLRQGTHKVKDVLKFVAVDVSLGNKKVQVALVKVQFVHHNGKAAVSYLVQHHGAMRINCLRKFAAWRSNQPFHPKCLTMTLSFWTLSR